MTHRRIHFIFGLYLLLFCAIFLKLFYWQVISYERLKSIAENQTLTSLSIPATRGNIYAQDGSPLVINQRAFLIYAQPHEIDKKDDAVSTLATSLSVDAATISALIVDTESRWVPVAHKVEENKIQKIKDAHLKGIGFLEEPKRFYPEGSMSAHLLGFVGKNSKGQDQGYFGIEGYYDEQLRGRDGMRRQEADALGNPILLGRFEDIGAENGRDLTLTIDKTAQYITQTKLKAGIEKYGAKGGTVTIMDPYTGSIIAMASFPSYDPAEYAKYPTEYYKNPAISSSYEPGSTFKVLVTAAGINEDKITATTIYDEKGPIKIGEYTINTWNHQYHGPITLTDVLRHSSNVGMVFIEEKLGHDLLLKYIQDYGFGETTDIDLQEESSPLLRSPENWYPIDFATASFGQGIAVTPLQIVRAVAAIANGGTLVRPYAVKSIDTKNGKTIITKPKIVKNVLKKETASVVSEMMVAAVDQGEAKRLKPPGYRVAGKTGTAQIPIAGHYDATKTIASFIGFAPVDNPKFVMLVTVHEPTSSQWGSETAVPIFFEIARDLFIYWGISPTS